jgi:PAS domain S-box-containing protein
LQAREEKLRGIFDGAMDSIVELDKDFNIVMLNPSAQKLFGVQAGTVVGASFEPFLVKKDFQRLSELIQTLNSRQHVDRKTWLPGGLAVINTIGEEILHRGNALPAGNAWSTLLCPHFQKC